MSRIDHYTVSELNNFIRDVIASGFPQAVWVCGEIQQFDRNKGKKHVFFELAEKEEGSSEIKARIGLVIFSTRKDFIENKIKENKEFFSLKDDIEVKFQCRVDFYAPHGAVRLIVEDIDPFYTLGKLAQEKQKLIKLLKEKGVLDKNKALELPIVPLNIGLITSHDSAAYNDFISELKSSGFGFTIYLRNTIMQGKKTEKDVCSAIESLEGIDGLDLIVITRGGGSIADLSCFDSQKIAEKIAGSALPVLSGIGHEINLTVTDLAAHTFAKTPTAIAAFIVGLVEKFRDEAESRITAVFDAALSRFVLEKDSLRDIAKNLQSSAQGYLSQNRERILGIKQEMVFKAENILKDKKEAISRLKDGLFKAAEAFLLDERKRAEHISKVLKIADPAQSLKRGFSITRSKEGKVIKTIEGIAPNSLLATQLYNGRIESTVNKIRKD
ncbi:MAG: exodeoxyribonuclease VII large subunit [Candidatus Omnitrophica bacterium]|nr:exodeoxyribonuclease VII large subunit [Candidatus Omnitrophota bacterium]